MDSVAQDHIDPVIIALPDEWESLTDAGRAMVEDKTNSQWRLGDLFIRASTRFLAATAKRGDQKRLLDDFASAIGENPSSLKVYYTVSAFYPCDARASFANLSYAHFKIAKRLGDLDSALAMLERASAEGWSTRQTTDAVKAALNEPPLARPLFDGYGTCVLDARTGTYSLMLDGDVSALGTRVIYAVRVWKTEDF